MTRIERDGETFVVPAPFLAEVFGIDEAEIKTAMCSGAITSRNETGVGADVGRWRLSFHHGDRALRLIVDAEGRILKRVRFPIRTPRNGPGNTGQKMR